MHEQPVPVGPLDEIVWGQEAPVGLVHHAIAVLITDDPIAILGHEDGITPSIQHPVAGAR
jgi:hypothetical protein